MMRFLKILTTSKKSYNVIALPVLIVTLILSSLAMPFYVVHANGSLPAPFIGWNVTMISYDLEYSYTSLGSQNLTLNSDIDSLTCLNTNSSGACTQFSMSDFSSIGYGSRKDLDFTLNIPAQNINSMSTAMNLYEIEFILDNFYIGYVDLSITDNTRTYNSTIYVNGSSFKFTTTYINTTFSITGYDLSLNDIYKDDWQFPIESFPSIVYLFNQGFEQVGINQHSNYMYPLFNSVTGVDIYNNIAANNGTILVMLIPSGISSIANFNNNFTYNSNLYVYSFTTLFVSSGNRICQVVFRKNDNSISTPMHLQWTQANKKFCIFYGNNVQANNIYPVSLEFGLTFGLNNRLLDDISIIANGTTNSNNSVSNADNVNQSVNNTFLQEEQAVSGAESSLNSNLQDLDIENQNNSLFGNNKFINSALWVRNRFNDMTTNNAYGYMITFAMVIGISLVIIGKLRG